MTKNSKIPIFTLSLLMPREIHSNDNTVSFLRRFTIGKSIHREILGTLRTIFKLSSGYFLCQSPKTFLDVY